MVFVMDSSGSIGSLNWMSSVQFVIDVIKGVKDSKDDTYVGVVTFSNDVYIGLDLNYYSMDFIEQTVFQLDYKAGDRNTAKGIKEMTDMFMSSGRD